MLFGMELGEALGAVAALEPEGLAARYLGQTRWVSARASPANTRGGRK